MKLYISLIFGIIKFVAIWLLTSCAHTPDERLVMAEAIMEQHPDSALQILEGMQLQENADQYDRNLYNLLLTHARYKNFIDETNDSVIRKTADYFIDKDDAEEASKALYLSGMIQYNAGDYEASAVSFTRGFDLAKENNIYMWEGQCARGLSMLYCDLFDGSSQLYYANQSYEAFSKGGYEDWMDYSRLNIAKALNNNGQIKEAKKIASELQTKSKVISDSLVYGESSAVLGLVLSQTGDYAEALRNYETAININPDYLEEVSDKVISMAISKVSPDSVPIGIKNYIENTKSEHYKPAFYVLAKNENYKEAYRELDKYCLEQDSLFKLISHNNVAKAINQYKDLDAEIKAERRAKHRLVAFGLGGLLLLVSIIAILLVRIKLHRKKMQIAELLIDLESIRKDLERHLKRENERNEFSMSADNSRPFIQVIKEKYSEANTICDNYYQNSGSKSANKKINTEVQELIRKLTDVESLKNISRYVDSISDNLYSSFSGEMHAIPEDYRRLYLYIILGLNTRSISVLFNQQPSAIYNKKSRLKSYILKSESSRKEEYLSMLK